METSTLDRPLTVQEAYDALDRFGRRAGRLPLLLLLHASVPQSFRADLLNLLKVNFLALEAGTDLTVDADVLLSPVVQRAAAGYYRLDPEVRRHALALLDAAYRDERERRTVKVARFILSYADAQEREATLSLDAMLAEYLAIQRWVALAFLDPAAAAEAFARAIEQGLQNTAAVAKLRLGSVTAAVSIPLAGHQELLTYARGVDALVSGDVPSARRWLDWRGEDELRVGGVTLRAGRALLADVAQPRGSEPGVTDRKPRLRWAYLSSTLDDLQPERDAVRAILAEKFIARSGHGVDESRPDAGPLRDMRDCDLYIGLIGLRYGHVPPGETRSVTHLEFEAATAQLIPRLIFIKNESAIPVSLTDAGAGLHRIRRFRKQLQAAVPAVVFDTVDDLREKLLQALDQLPGTSDGGERQAGPDAGSQQPVARTDYTCDVFVSYAHLDNVELAEGRGGWVGIFVRALQIRLSQRIGREISVQWDPKLAGSDLFAETLPAMVSGAAAFVAIVSPRYVKSEWARREVAAFVEAAAALGGLTWGGKSRLFKVLKTPVPLESQPEGVRPFLGYEFFKIEPDTGKIREFDEMFGPESQREFWLKLDDLAHDIAQLLEQPPQAPATRLRTIRILLASSTELREDRDAFDLHFRQQNDQLRNTGLHLEIVRWEDFLDAMSDTRLQDEYNKAVRESDVFVSLFFTKTGKFAEEAFDIVHRQFVETGRPRICIFFRRDRVTIGNVTREERGDLKSLGVFQEKLKSLGHFYASYDNIDQLKLQFRDHLDKILEE